VPCRRVRHHRRERQGGLQLQRHLPELDHIPAANKDLVLTYDDAHGTPEHRYTGTWSDGVPVIPLKIQDTAPIRP
jgi:hypothetical protein